MKDPETTLGMCVAAIGYIITQIPPDAPAPWWLPWVGKCMVVVGLIVTGYFSTQIKSLLGAASRGILAPPKLEKPE